MRFYLDTSALVKRYVQEKGSEVIDRLYEKTNKGEAEIVMSLWNVGEFIGVLDKYKNRGEISEKEFQNALSAMFSETEKLLTQKNLTIEYLDPNLLSSSWGLIIKHGIYAADALQIISALLNSCEYLLSGDQRLIDVAKREGLDAINIEKEVLPE
ncbi:MAG: type II toxin-antitoxin system VapC family toxin [Euryarchaeota archaeon]|nr:type II toxin-antitoxin system VapC family toxin [Euryarchaeota archaeon]